MDITLTLLRIAIGALLAAHGAQKLFGWFGGYGIHGTGGWLESIGYRPGRLQAVLAGTSEFAGGVLLALGLFTPLAGLLIIPPMIVAVAFHLPNGPFATNGGYELPLTNALAAAAFTTIAPTAISLDAVLGLAALYSPAVTLGAVLLGLVGGLGTIATRRKTLEAAAR